MTMTELVLAKKYYYYISVWSFIAYACSLWECPWGDVINSGSDPDPGP